MTRHHRWLVRHSMEHLAFLEDRLAELDRETAERVKTHAGLQSAVNLVQSIPGIKETAAAAITAETGYDMGQFPEAGQLASWTGVCPGNNESAGKRKSGRTNRGNPWARRALVECAWSASRKKDSASQNLYQQLKPRIQHKRALGATAHWIVRKIHEVLSTGKPYQQDPDPKLTSAQALRLARHHSRRLQHLHKWLPKEYRISLVPSGPRVRLLAWYFQPRHPRPSAAAKRVSPRPAWLTERPAIRVRKDLAAFFEFFTPLHCVARPQAAGIPPQAEPASVAPPCDRWRKQIH